MLLFGDSGESLVRLGIWQHPLILSLTQSLAYVYLVVRPKKAGEVVIPS